LPVFTKATELPLHTLTILQSCEAEVWLQFS